MKKQMLIFAALIALTSPALGQEDGVKEHPSPNAIVGAAQPAEWVQIPAEDLLVMTLADDSDGASREVVIQLMPAPFSQGWVSNIRTLARAKWYDGITVNRVQDNYVVQWGDANGEDPEKAKPLPEGLKVMDEGDYTINQVDWQIHFNGGQNSPKNRAEILQDLEAVGEPPIVGDWTPDILSTRTKNAKHGWHQRDSYAAFTELFEGWPIASTQQSVNDDFWPVHCYGMVGVGRNYSPDTGSGAELYTVIGHAPRHLDRNIALVGRIISGMEHLSSMKRGSGELGFYTEDEAGLRTPIQSIRVTSDMPANAGPASSSEAVGSKYAYEYLSTESETFAKYAEARANRRDPFFIKPAGGADICNIPVPVRQVASD